MGFLESITNRHDKKTNRHDKETKVRDHLEFGSLLCAGSLEYLVDVRDELRREAKSDD
jgi:hypothetical protein